MAPICAVGWSKRGRTGWRRDVGGSVDTVFDLASVTKPFTAFAVARSTLLSRGAHLREVLPEVAGAFAGASTIETLLAHRSGLVGHVPLFLPLVDGFSFDPSRALVEAAESVETPLTKDLTQHAPVYSDLGYMLVGAALSRAHRAVDAGAVIEAEVVQPLGDLTLGTARTLAEKIADWPHRVAATELVPWRGGKVRGAVHDENAWALTGLGGSGHAGLFGDLSSVMRFGEAAMDAIVHEKGPLAAGDLSWMIHERPGGTLRAGFDGKSTSGSSAGVKTSMRTFGHLGFTGTSLWIDPEAEVVLVMLTNRVDPSRANDRIRAARPVVNDALYELATNAI